MNDQRVALLEAILFTTADPLSLDDIQKIMRGRRDEIEKTLNVLRERYASPSSGIRLSDIGGFKLIVKTEFNQNVSTLTPHADMSRGLLRVLSIIAYHEPIKQSDIVKVIGNRTYEYVKELVDKGFIHVEKKSRTRILSTTPRFEEYFETKKDELKKMLVDKKEEETPEKNTDPERK